MVISSRSRRLFEQLLMAGGSIRVHEQEISKAADIRDLIDSGFAEGTTEGVIRPSVKLRLTLPDEEVMVLKDIYSSARGVAVISIKDQTKLTRIKFWKDSGLVQTITRDGVAYLLKI